MKEGGRGIRNYYGFLSKNRVFFALAGVFVAILAIFSPIFSHVYGPNKFFLELYMYGVFRVWSPKSGVIIFYNLHEMQNKASASAVSVYSTLIAGIIILASILISLYTLVWQRKKEKYSSRLLLLTSFGLLTTLISYLILMDFSSHDVNPYPTNWIHEFGITPLGSGAVLILVSSILMLAGYTVKIRPLFMFLALVAAELVFYNSVLNLQRYFYWEAANFLDPIPPEVHAWNVSEFLNPGLNLLYVSLAMVGADGIAYAVFKIIKKRRTRQD
jgi:hypothetical protein